jgi:DNA-binding NtrC family response regulator
MMANDLQILIVEDKPEMHSHLVESIMSDPDIERYNPKTTVAPSLSRLQSIWAEKFSKTPPEIAILDHRLAGKENGLQVALWLIERVPKIRIIVLTSYPLDTLPNGEKAFQAYEKLPNPENIVDRVIVIKKESKTVTIAGEMRTITVWHEVQHLLLQRIKTVRQVVSTTHRNLYNELCAHSRSFQLCLEKAVDVADSEYTVLLTGETGVGKGELAKFIRKNSKRQDNDLVTINCSSIPGPLLESELFGHEKGAFTGASERKLGLFETFKDGTIFLDEIGEMPIDQQVKLLNVLEDRTFMRVGGREIIKTNARFIAGTNRNLNKQVEDGLFRLDLYYRLAVVCIHIPPLRERQEDIIPLAEFFITKFLKKNNLEGVYYYLSEPAQIVLSEYRWPGNVRELENTIERALLFYVKKGRCQISSSDLQFLMKSQETKQHQTREGEETLADGKGYSLNTLTDLGQWSELDIHQLMELSRKIWETLGEIINYDVNEIRGMSSGFKGDSWMYVKAILAIFWQAHQEHNVVLTEELFCEIFGFHKGTPFHVWLYNKGKGKESGKVFPKRKNGSFYCFTESFIADVIDLREKGIFLDINNYQREDREVR